MHLSYKKAGFYLYLNSMLIMYNTVISKIFAFYHLLENALGRQGRRNHVDICQNCFDVFEGFKRF